MTKLVIILLIISFSLSVSGQDRSPAKFGKISAAELKTKSYQIDTNAAAMVMADIGYSKIIGNLKGWFSIEFKHFRRIHILKSSGYDLANVEILLYKDGAGEEELKGLKAHTYNLENGRIVASKLDVKNAVYRSVAGKNHIIKKFAFPAVREGSVIEYEYTIHSDFIFNLQPWKFQHDYPVLWSEYNVSIPEFLYYIFFQQGGFSKMQTSRQEMFSVIESKTATRSMALPFTATVNEYQMVMKNVLPVRDESFISSRENHVARIAFQLAEYRSPLPEKSIIGDWTGVTQSLSDDENFGGQLKKDNSWLNDELKMVLGNAETDEHKARNVFHWLQKNFSCTNYKQIYTDQALKSVFKNRKGSVAEINLLLVAMLNKAGIKADPLILSTRSNGYTYSNYPVIEQFNYVICRLLLYDKPVYLDASKSKLGFGKLDWECYNGHARVIDVTTTPVELHSDSLKEISVTSLLLFVEPEGVITGRGEQTPGYYGSFTARNIISEEGLHAYINSRQAEKAPDVEIIDYRIDNLTELDEPIRVSYEFRLIPTGGELIYLDPLAGEGFTENPFEAEQRTYPVEMPYTLDETFITRIQLAGGYEVAELPASARVNLDAEGKSYFEYLVQHADGVVRIRSRVKVHRSYFLPEEYKLLKDFFTLVVQKQNEKVVLKKKK